jgi:glycine/D-amino acid oxidase-like deaminating enzyme
MSQLPSHSQIVIIGGGVVGCSLAWHLAQLGRRGLGCVERPEDVGAGEAIAGRWDIDIAGQRRPATASLQPAWP